MSRLPRRPMRSKSRHVATSLSFLFLAFFALILLCPVAVNADDDKKSEYGTVIGIGMCRSLLSFQRMGIDFRTL